MTLITLEEAEQEFVESVAYYESKEPGLGLRFRDEVAAAVDWIARFPEVPRLRRMGYRRVNLCAFPHYVAYIIRGGRFGLWRLRMAIGAQSFGSRGYDGEPDHWSQQPPAVHAQGLAWRFRAFLLRSTPVHGGCGSVLGRSITPCTSNKQRSRL
jgi:hypothetical protein